MENETAEGTTCKLCQVTLQVGESRIANGHTVCPACFAQIEREIAAQEVTMKAFPLAIIGGGIGAVLAAAIWAAIGISTGYEVGYIAVLVGFLAGKGVIVLNGAQRGRVLQVAAVAAALGGLVLAKLALLDYFVVQEFAKQGESFGYVSFAAIFTSLIMLPQTLSFFDILWVYLAVQVAWQLPRAAQLKAA